MRLVVDAQLPQLLAVHLTSLGHDATHVKELPRAGATSDAEIAAFADGEDRIVVTKDVDFADGHRLLGSPRRLLRVTTGNIRNVELLSLIAEHLDAVERAFARSDLVELGVDGLVVHERRGRPRR